MVGMIQEEAAPGREGFTHLRGGAALALAVALSAACIAEEPALRDSRRSCAAEDCILDPTAHCVFPDACESSADCPSGTRCVSRRSGICDGGTCRVCEAVQSPSTASLGLINGFKVRQFELEALGEQDGPGSFAWGRPRDAVAVACALFVCAPEFTLADEFEGDPILDFVNYEQCAVLEQKFDLRDIDTTDVSLSFDLAIAAPFGGNRSACPGRVSPGSAYNDAYTLGQPRVTSLLAGCWAYDYDRVIAATPLLPVAPAQLPGADRSPPVESCKNNVGLPCYKDGQVEKCGRSACQHVPEGEEPELPLVVSSCDSPGHETDGLNCFPTELGGYGTCQGDVCRVNCTSRIDCDALPAPSDDEDERATCCKQIPRPGADTFLGVCRRENEPKPDSFYCTPLPDGGT